MQKVEQCFIIRPNNFTTHMSLVPWKPFRDLDRLFGEDDWLVTPFPRLENFPAMDVYENEKTVTAELDLPNIDPDNIEVTVDNDMLTIRGSHEEEKEEKNKEYTRREIRRGAFTRSVRLPAHVKAHKADATYEDGLLKIVMEKTEPKESEKKIEIKRK